MYTDINKLLLGPNCTIPEAIAQLDIGRVGIILILDQSGRLEGTVTDGDIRRAILNGNDLEGSIDKLLGLKGGSAYAKPITALVGTSESQLLATLQEHKILHLPIVDFQAKVVDLVTLSDLVPSQGLGLNAVVMAGGQGSRLRPLTEDVPKPMLPVGNRPLLELIIDQLRDSGVGHINVSVHHKSEKIIDHFGDGTNFGVSISYLTEDQPLGTVGALGLMGSPRETMLVINGDILTKIDFKAMLAYHRENDSDLTVAVQSHEIQVPYGVIECQDTWVDRVVEKPLLKFFINAGIYLLEPIVMDLIPHGKPYDMTDLIQQLLTDGKSVAAFPVIEYWADVGRHEDYQRVIEDAKHLKGTI